MENIMEKLREIDEVISDLNRNNSKLNDIEQRLNPTPLQAQCDKIERPIDVLGILTYQHANLKELVAEQRDSLQRIDDLIEATPSDKCVGG